MQKDSIAFFLKKIRMTSTTPVASSVIMQEEPMEWKKIEVDNAVLTLWPGAVVRDSDLNGIHAFFQKEFDIQITPVGCVETLPDSDEHGESIEGTGGRVDFFFFVNAKDMSKFAIPRFKFGMRWWEDIYFNNGEDIYPIEFCLAYPDPCER